MNDQEEEFVRRFIVEEKQQRYLGFLSSSKNRGKFLHELYHRLAIRSSLAEEVPSRERTVEKLEPRLRQKGAGSQVYMISPNSELDQRLLPLAEALSILFSTSTEAILCCKIGELAFYQSEDSAWILCDNRSQTGTASGKHKVE